jgi:hypothetical protein
MHDILPWQFFNFKFVRVLGMAGVRGADVAECLEVADKIKKNDAESWFRAWRSAAESAEVAAESALSSGDKEAARWAYLRASNYRRASE